MKYKTQHQTVIAGLTRNLQIKKRFSLRLGDGGCSSAMTVKALAMILVATLMVSCEKEIEFNGEHSDPRLVINSLVEPEESVKAFINKSYFFLDAPDTSTPEDLVATLYVNDNRIGEMVPFFDTVWEYYGIVSYHLVPGFYHDFCPQVGDVVKITASANGFEDAEGITSPLPQINDYQMEVEVTDWHAEYIHPHFDSYGEYEEDSVLNVWGYLNLIVSLTDPNPGKTDYFRIVVDKRTRNNEGENSVFYTLDYDDPVFGVGVTENDLIDASDFDTRPEGVFTDFLFDESSYRLKIKVYFECDVDEVFEPDFFRVPFLLEHLSKEYYNYLNTCNQGDEYTQFFAEPIQTYSNVTNGYGIVAGRAVDTLWVNLPLSE